MEGSVNINVDGNIFDALKQLNDQFKGLQSRVEGVEKTNRNAFAKISQQIKSINLVAITQQFQNLTNSLNELNRPGLKFQTSLADLSAITGQTGKDLDLLGSMARKNAKEFGGSAAQSVETFKLLLSQLGPDLAKTPTLLNEMARKAETLAKTMGGDVVGATEVLTTAMNQFNVDMSDPAAAVQKLDEFMNAMSASAKEGQSELPQLKEAVSNVGGVANEAGMKFNTMLSAIQFMDKAGKKGAEGGVALRNVLATLSMGRFLPKDVQKELIAAGVNVQMLSDKTVPFTDKMRELRKVSSDAALITKLFGKENELGAMAMIHSADAQDKMTASIEGTKTTYEQAKVVMETTEEKVKRMNASMEDAKIKFFDATGGAFAYLQPVSELAVTMSGLSAAVQLSSSLIKLLRMDKLATAVATNVLTVATKAWGLAMKMTPVGMITTALAGLAAITWAVKGAFDNATEAEKLNTEAKKRAIEKMSDEKVSLELLFNKLKSAKVGTKEYTSALDELKAKYPGLLDKYNLHLGKVEDIEAAESNLMRTMKRRIDMEVAEEMYKEAKKATEQARQDGPTAGDYIKHGPLAKVQFLNDELRAEKAAADRLEALNKTAAFQDAVGGSGAANVWFKKLGGGQLGPAEQTGGTPGAGSGAKSVPTISANMGETKEYDSSKTVKSVVVNIQNLMSGDLVIQTKNLQESAGMVKQRITEALVGAVRDFEVAM